MRLSPLFTLLAALVAVVIIGATAARFLQPPRPLLADAGLSLNQISPNGDGQEDATRIQYTLNRNARVTISFRRNISGTEYIFRKDELRAADSYQVLFSGVVNGYTLPNEQIGGAIEARLLPNDLYVWTISAIAEDGESAQTSGNLIVNDADTELPLIRDFSVSPAIFTPNQDGVDDRVTANVYLSKKATLTVYLQDAKGTRYYVPERVEMRQPGEPGAHVFDYDGGVDNDVTPPPDGDYTLVAVAEDIEGQRVRRTSQITLKDGGLPQVEIQAQTSGSTVTYGTQPYTTGSVQPPAGVTSTQAKLQLNQNDLLTFRLTVYNYGKTPLRTMGPWPGQVYGWDQLAAKYTDPTISKSGIWRVGLTCETSETDFPWRWAIGAPDKLHKVVDDKGQTFYYLNPGESATVWGAVQMSYLVKSRNPQDCWAALIHEDVIIPPAQSHVGPIKVELIPAP